MRKFTLLLLVYSALALSTPFSATASFVKEPSATPTIETLKHLKLIDYINIGPNDFSMFRGKKMNIWDKISFKVMKMNMKREIKANPNITVKEYYRKMRHQRLAWGWWVAISLSTLLIIILILAAATLGSWN